LSAHIQRGSPFSVSFCFILFDHSACSLHPRSCPSTQAVRSHVLRERNGNMNLKRPLLSILGLALVVLSLAGASTAFASEAEWKIGGKTFAELGIKEASVLGSASETFVLNIPWYATEISCKSLEVSEGKILTAGGSRDTFKMSSCALTGPPFVSETCKLVEPIEYKLKDTLILHGGKPYDLIEPVEAGKPLATITFKEGTECPLPLKNEVTGSLVGEISSGEVVKQQLLFNSTLETLFASHTLKFGSKLAKLTGKAVLDLSGAFEGKVWGGSETILPPPSKTWRIEGTAFAGEEAITGTGEEVEFLFGAFLGEINCTGSEIKNGKIFESDKLLAEILYNGCTVLGNKFCKVYETKMDMELATNPEHFILKLKALLLLHESISGGKKHYLLVEEDGGQYGTIFLSSSTKGCGLPLESTFSGSTIMELSDVLTSQLTHLIKPLLDMEIQLLFREELKATFGEHGAELPYGTERIELHKGLTTIKLIGANMGRNWSGE
jgi:hypothetical protein